MTPDQVIKINKLRIWRQQFIEKEKEFSMFMGLPDRWYEKGPYYRCLNSHISTTILKSEAFGSDVCLECYEPVILTFPEDSENVLV